MKSKLLFALMILFVVAFIGLMFFLVIRLTDSITPDTEVSTPDESIPETVAELVEETTAPVYPYAIVSGMDNLLNEDMVGWITIPYSGIDYPVMQDFYDPDFYLTHDFYKNTSPYGCPYVQTDCNIFTPSDNIIIYSHYMNDGTMFAPLEKYKDVSFFKSHKNIYLNIEGKELRYKILAFIVLPYTANDANTLKFYQFTDAYDPKSFNDFVAKCKKLSLYDTGMTAKYGDKLLTLATAEYNASKERLLVIAKQG